MNQQATYAARKGWLQTWNMRVAGSVLGGLAFLVLGVSLFRVATTGGTGLPARASALFFVLLGVSLPLAWRMVFGGLKIEPAGLTVRNPLSTHTIPWEAVNAARPVTPWDVRVSGRPGDVIIELRDGQVIKLYSVGPAGVEHVYGESGTGWLIDHVNECRRQYSGVTA